MLPDDAFLRRLPNVLSGKELVYLEALVWSADVIETSIGIIKRTTAVWREKICDAPRGVHIELFTHAWSIVDCVYVIKQLFCSLDYQTPLAVSFQEKYNSASTLRNKMDHLAKNALNVANAKNRPPVFGALGYICIPNKNIKEEKSITIDGGGMVMIAAGRFAGSQKVNLINPVEVEFVGFTGGFRIEAFDDFLELESVARDLKILMSEVNDRLEKNFLEQAEVYSKEHGVPVEKILSNSVAGMCLFLAFQLDKK